MLEISEPVNVWVLFKGVSIQPWCFFWRNRKIKVDKINLVHTSKEGATIFYYFSVSSGENFYRLKLDAKNFQWFLEAVEEG